MPSNLHVGKDLETILRLSKAYLVTPSSQANTECTVAFFYSAADQLKSATTKLN